MITIRKILKKKSNERGQSLQRGKHRTSSQKLRLQAWLVRYSSVTEKHGSPISREPRLQPWEFRVSGVIKA